MNDYEARVDKKDYNKQMSHPRWQRRRPVIFKRDKWRCRFCFDDSTTLHVHHVEYAPGADAWAYPDSELLTLCEDCHWIMQFCSPKRPRTRHSMAMLLRAANQYAVQNVLSVMSGAPYPNLKDEVNSVPQWEEPDDAT